MVHPVVGLQELDLGNSISVALGSGSNTSSEGDTLVSVAGWVVGITSQPSILTVRLRVPPRRR